ncbi:MAG: NAD(P)-dependent oxidoreductase [Flavobacteriales bacterium]|nr:NAD(P)-dependent oxidoreductase [Flavobacteriales bacterium]
MKIGIIKEGKTPPDKRVALTPEHCKHLEGAYPELEIRVQRSPIRCFADQEYEAIGVQLVDSVSDCDVIFGVKEVKYEMLAEGKTMLFFSHTIKKQPYNRDLLREVLKKNVRLIDYETLTYSNGARVLGFGRYAGIVGAYNALIAYGKRYGTFEMKPAHLCADMKEMGREMKKVQLGNAKIIISGGGKVANGAKETFKEAGIRQVSIPEFLNQEFDEPVYCNADILDYHEKDGNPPANFAEFVKDSTVWENTFTKFTNVADIFISAHFWDNKSAHFFTEEDVKSDDFKVKVIADITCDIKGSVPTTLRPSTIADPIYGYDRTTGEEAEPYAENSITIMAVDNLPCEVPKDASEGFGQDLIEKIIPLFLGKDSEKILERATIAQDGKLTQYFRYLQDYVDGNS